MKRVVSGQAHLKMKGLLGAADLLEKHVVQVEAPEGGLSLQDIYKAWIKLCSISQQAKQPAKDESNQVEPEGGSDKTLTEGNIDVNASLASEQTMEANGDIHNVSPDDEEEARKQPQLIMDAEEVQGETSGLEEAAVHQTEATPTPNDDTETSEQAMPTCAQDAQEQPTDNQALPPADMRTEQEEEEVAVKMEISDGLKQEDHTEAPEDQEAIDDGKMSTAEERDHMKKGKKRKKHDEDKLSEIEVAKRKKVEDIKDEKVQEGVSPPEEEEKKKEKKRRRRRKKKTGERSQEVQYDAPAGSNAETPKKQEAAGDAAPQLSSSRKMHPQKKLSRKKRMRLKKSQQGHKQDIPEESKASKPETYATSEVDAPKSKKIKQDQSPATNGKKDKKKKKQRTASEEKIEHAVGNIEHLSGGHSAHLSEEKKKKKKAAEYDETPVSNKTSAKKIKKRLKYQKEDGRLPVASF
ncbi:glutamic acid-rich protein-like isoform X2 [Dunckerocampus dactyliophorus]|uniref:glutamic acid-rich protein-like isoform X2 n=1 Tax=Dunckerocampus dactyliophorus TaxID=161453 RepID=UPI0024069366|nr:glutamic acid-rich protein-like isoform X2 [Dunckerocampus dactyliophorus]